ncbi:DUF1697 domain-containing protein [Leifsonia poae]|uniref:DUF1697 domain-containing protein n=1 Tax=Leifsonia poae TaxID=110933 RepID=UPI001CBDA646|nr:DUF1697 domain-containing protein [Leifsonia poae]
MTDSHGVGLVRGINVGASTKVSKTDLVAAFEGAGLGAVTTLLQSGNVVFDIAQPLDALVASRVEAGLARRSGVSARVLLLEEGEFRRIAAENPLLGVADDFSKLVVTFVGGEISDELAAPSADGLAPEVVQLGRRAVYQWCPLGVSKSQLKPAFWRGLGGVMTGRNWRTVLRILEELDTRA